jgi:Icc-related predicted phosphoesterase
MKETVRIAALGDPHFGKAGRAALQPVFSQVNDAADVLVLCGDLTDYGLPEEAQLLARELTTTVKVPVVAVLGNHDYESGKVDEIRRILTDAGAALLDGDSCEVLGVGFAGTKGFGGGFGERALQAWGEESTKRFVHEAVEEALKLESALARLRTPHRIAVLHYAPVQATVEGEPPEIYPFLGSSRLEEPLSRYNVTATFHGHAHHGRLEGRTRGDTPVYNVAIPLLKLAFPDRPPFRVVELSMTTAEPAGSGARSQANGAG